MRLRLSQLVGPGAARRALLLALLTVPSGCNLVADSAPIEGVTARATTPPVGPPTMAPTSPPATNQPATPVATAAPQAAATATAGTTQPTAQASTVAEPRFVYPIGLPGRPPGDGFFIRHGFQVENTWFNPGDWHAGEDWYATEGDTAGASVYAIADGEVVYAGANYPGRVVIVRHADDLYSMYGHLDPALLVGEGQRVQRGEPLGVVLRRGDRVPNHLHFESRAFLTAAEINGARPRYGYRCGLECPPGPGYWPIGAPELPAQVGWYNPTHVINQRAFEANAQPPIGEVVVATRPFSPSLTLWDGPPGQQPRSALGEVALIGGERFALLEIAAGPVTPTSTSANAYTLWYRITLPDERSGWVQAAVSSLYETGADGRPSTVSFNILLASPGAR